MRSSLGKRATLLSEYRKRLELPAKSPTAKNSAAISVPANISRNNPNAALLNSSAARPNAQLRTINMTRDEVNNVIYKELEKILTTTNIVPHFENNKMVGIRFNKLNENSVISRYFGVKLNDIISSINGRPVDSIEKGMKLWDNIKTENYISLDIIRDGEHYLYTLNIEE